MNRSWTSSTPFNCFRLRNGGTSCWRSSTCSLNDGFVFGILQKGKRLHARCPSPGTDELLGIINACQSKDENAAVNDQMLSSLADVLAVVDSAEFAVPAVEQNELYNTPEYK